MIVEKAGEGTRLRYVNAYLTSLVALAHLEAYHDARRPDCFRRVAGALRTHCGELEVDEGERIRGDLQRLNGGYMR